MSLTPITKSPHNEYPSASYYMAPSTFVRPAIQDCSCKSVRVSFPYNFQFFFGEQMPMTRSNIEANFMIICASLPYLRQFLRHHLPRFFSRDIENNLQSPSPRYTPTKKMQTPRMTTASEDLEMNRTETDGVESTRNAEDRDDAAPQLADTRESQQ